MSQDSGQISFPKMEEETLKRWDEKKVFQKSLEINSEAYTFYDGPPFATGLPHYGHLLPSTLKDIVPRYWTMRGYKVPRRWGWDCHGLPIEQEIDKKHQFKSTEEIEKFGIAKYNEECRSIVLRFTSEWERVITRLGRWVDFKNDYKTMDLNFMESVWWVFNQLWQKKLIYRGYKVMHFSTALGTPLSNFEAGNNYQNVQDPAITVRFELKDRANTYFLAWTTTPWTLPSNLALAVGRDLEYVELKTKDGSHYILAEALVENHFKKDEVEIQKELKGQDLIGLSYTPLFPYFSDKSAPHFSVIESGHVTTESGTGIVHMAPAFGEEDFNACRKLNFDIVCPVDNHGRFTEQVSDYSGQYVKDADKEIIKDLKASGNLFKQDTIQHSYAFCPRTDTPLIYRAVSSWFVNVEKIKAELQKNNATQTHWVPEHLRDGRFGKWLENARDWAISRNRFWGNPLPIFESFEDPEDERKYICVGSLKELKALTGQDFKDLHRESLDGIVFEKAGKKYKRVPEVLDCWFESGSMPYAQYHYPFENKEKFEKEFPADFIGEGLDQTRGWFYTLSVLGTILFDRIPFKNVVVNGLILAEDGKKMSKRLKNYPDPMEVIHKYGADALRLYLIDSPVIRAEELRFSETGVREIVRKVILKIWNAYSFFDSYAKIDNYTANYGDEAPLSDNTMDRWILSRMQSLLARVEAEMTEYHLYNVVPEILNYVEELTNTYIRLNRSRFWAEGMPADKKSAFDTLHYVIVNFSKVLAPFAPFISDEVYLRMSNAQKESVHLEKYPRANEALIDSELETAVLLLENILIQARNLREQNKIKVKIPLKKLIVIHRSSKTLESLRVLEGFLKSELNVREVEYRTDEESFVSIQIKANGASLGPKAGKRMKELMKEISQLSIEDLDKVDRGESVVVGGDFNLEASDLSIHRNAVSDTTPTNASRYIAVAIDPSVDPDQELEGLAREVVNRIQKSRKDIGLELDNRIQIEMNSPKEIKSAVEAHMDYIKEQTLATEIQFVESIQLEHKLELELEKEKLILGIQKI